MGTETLRVTVWNEGRHEKTHAEVTNVYPNGPHSVIAEGLQAHGYTQVRTATLDDPVHGLTEAVLAEVRLALEAGRVEDAVRLLSDQRTADLVDVFSELEDEEQVDLLPRLETEDSADILEYLDDPEAAELAGAVAEVSAEQATRVFDLPAGEAGEILKRFEGRVERRCLPVCAIDADRA